jgi:hypothetical protein
MLIILICSLHFVYIFQIIILYPINMYNYYTNLKLFKERHERTHQKQLRKSKGNLGTMCLTPKKTKSL